MALLHSVFGPDANIDPKFVLLQVQPEELLLEDAIQSQDN